MSALSDSIEEFIKSMLTEDDGQAVDLQRNELAQHFNCAPSHITYVISTRFTLERGYRVSSKRGGGGYVRVIRLKTDKDDLIYNYAAYRLDRSISQREATAMVDALLSNQAVTKREAAMLKASLKDKAICVPAAIKDGVRASIFRAQLIALLEQEED